MLQEFRDFIAKGNVMDMAVGIIIGAAFTGIVQSLVQDLINPLVGLFTGGVDFTNLFVTLGSADYASLEAARAAGATVFAWGAFVTAVINFLIIAWVVFLLVKTVNRIRTMAVRDDDVAPDVPTGPSERDLLMDIRDALRAQ